MSNPPLTAILFVGGADPHGASLVLALREAGFEVHEAATEAQALERLREGPALVILANGPPDLCGRIKADPRTAAVPVLRLGESSDGRPDACLRERADSIELLNHVHALLRLGRAEAALRASEARLRDILDHAPVVAHVKDLEGRYLLVNRRWETLFHFRRDEVVGKSGSDVHPAAEADALRANDLQVFQAGGPLEFEEVVSQDDGPHIYLSEKFVLADESGKPYAVCGISTDITDRKRAEEAVRDSEALYHSLVEGLPVCLLRKDLRGRFTFANRAFAPP